jgi:hypothetical protein
LPSTAEDIVLFEEKQKYIYSLVQASHGKKSSLIDQGADRDMGTINAKQCIHKSLPDPAAFLALAHVQLPAQPAPTTLYLLQLHMRLPKQLCLYGCW